MHSILEIEAIGSLGLGPISAIPILDVEDKTMPFKTSLQCPQNSQPLFNHTALATFDTPNTCNPQWQQTLGTTKIGMHFVVILETWHISTHACFSGPITKSAPPIFANDPFAIILHHLP